MIDYIDPTHGIIMAAIGAALFASLLVAWLWGRRGRVPEFKLSERIQFGQMRTDADLADMGRPLLSQYVHDPKPAPYSPGITGTGSRPVNPLEERVAALEARLARLEAGIVREFLEWRASQ